MRQSSIGFLLVSVVIWLSGEAGAQAASELDHWFARAAALNRPNLSEPAGSHGAQGLALATGLSRYQAAQGTELSDQEFADEDAPATEVRRLWLVKGLPWPVDLLFTGGQEANQHFSQATAALQWNIFEGLALPTVALRASAGGLFGCDATEARALGLELVGSFSPLSYLTLFATAGTLTNSVTVHAHDESPTAYFLTDGETSRDFNRNWRTINHSVGLRLLLLPPFVSTAAELLYERGNILGGSIKLSFGI